MRIKWDHVHEGFRIVVGTENVYHKSGPFQEVEFSPYDPKEEVLVRVLHTVMRVRGREQARAGRHLETRILFRLRGHGEESQLLARTVGDEPPARHGNLRGMKLLADALSKQRGTEKKHSDLFLLPVPPISQTETAANLAR